MMKRKMNKKNLNLSALVNILLVVGTPQNLCNGFQSLSITTMSKFTRIRPFTSTAFQLASASVDDEEERSESKLTKQEEILQNALNIEPESMEEKSQRQVQTQLIQEEQTKSKTTNILIAVLSFTAAVINYLYQYMHPVTDVQLLFAMSQSSTPLTEIGTNGKPTGKPNGRI